MKKNYTNSDYNSVASLWFYISYQGRRKLVGKMGRVGNCPLNFLQTVSLKNNVVFGFAHPDSNSYATADITRFIHHIVVMKFLQNWMVNLKKKNFWFQVAGGIFSNVNISKKIETRSILLRNLVPNQQCHYDKYIIIS